MISDKTNSYKNNGSSSLYIEADDDYLSPPTANYWGWLWLKQINGDSLLNTEDDYEILMTDADGVCWRLQATKRIKAEED